MVGIGDVVSAVMHASQGSKSGSGFSNSALSRILPGKLKHWGVYVGDGMVVSLNGEGYIEKDSLSENWPDYEIHSKGWSKMAEVACKLYNEYLGRRFFDYVLIVTDCQTFITYVREKASSTSPAYNIAKVMTLGVGTSVGSAYVESVDTAAAWIQKAETPIGQVGRALVSLPLTPILTVAKIPGYFLSTILSPFK